MFDCVELFCSHGTWFDCHREAGLRMCPGMALDYAALEDQATFLELARLASSGAVREWHAGPPCWSFGTFKQPRLRSRDEPAGFEMAEPTTLRHTKLAIRTAFILILAMLSGSFVSCEQPSSSVMFHLHIFQVLRRLGCWVSHFHSCAFGSGFNKPSLWLHNKPWLLRLDGVCRCPSRGRHFIIEGTFSRGSIAEFKRRCRPSCVEVYGVDPIVGEAVSAFSARYPLELCRQMAAGRVAFDSARPLACGSGCRVTLSGVTPGPDIDRPRLRAWHEDPAWVEDLCETLPYRELFRYRFKERGHINVLECRVYKSWLKQCSKRWPRHRILGLLDSRVTMGAAAKGRSSSRALSRVLRTALPYVLGGGLYSGTLHCRSAWNRADAPSRARAVEPPSGPKASWISQLEVGNVVPFDRMVRACDWARPVGRWARLPLLIAGDVEPNPGPVRVSNYTPRGELNLFGGLTQATSQRMQKCLDAFQLWLRDEFSLDLEFALASSEHANLSLRAYGRWLYERGSPRYHFVYCVTAVQRVRPEFKGLLGGAWHVDRMWQLEEPGQCRAVLSSAMVRAIICLGLLWGWRQFVGVISLGFGGMLHPNEFVHLCRQDLVFPEDALTASSTLYVHIRSPKTARFARKQHARIDDPSILHLARQLFFDLPLGSRLFDASLAVFRRQWNHLLDFLEIPRRQAQRGATPGVLRGSGATAMYLDTEDLPKVAWRGRWARSRTLEYYIQEVAAQLFLHQLSPRARERIQFLEQHCASVATALLSETSC